MGSEGQIVQAQLDAAFLFVSVYLQNVSLVQVLIAARRLAGEGTSYVHQRAPACCTWGPDSRPTVFTYTYAFPFHKFVR